MARALNPLAVWGLLREAKAALEDARPLHVSGEGAEQLARELARGGELAAVRASGRVEDAAALVRVLAGSSTEEDERELRAANRARVPVVVVQTSGEARDDVPYVLPTDVVHLRPDGGLPLDEIARCLAGRLGESGTALAARLPVLRGAVCDELIDDFSRKNGILGAAIFVPGADLPVLTLNQLRLVLRLASAYGVDVDQSRAPEILATLGAGFGFRTVARQLLGAVPVAGWALKGAVAYGGTRALGEAARRYFASIAAPPPPR
ncbi:MAG: hypothetical protein H0U07_05250 [Actinobacteria bacterium]|nr:hypothetical protein [Actinomycetota bacterium]